jgi:hypothetical protein
VTLDRATVLAALRAEDLVRHYAIPGQWRGRWLRSSRCATDDHGTDAFGISRDGHWHCHACDKGGDALKLIATGEKLDMRQDFPRILEIAAEIAGIEDDEIFGALPPRAPRERPPVAPVPPLAERVERAKKRAAWVWDRLSEETRGADMYLRSRKLDPVGVRAHDDIRETPMRCSPAEWVGKPDLKSLSYLFASPGVALPVRCVTTGEKVDIRVRRVEPREDQPKIIGMLGGVTSGPAEGGRTRQLVGCYGFPHSIDPGPSKTVVVCEGWADYLTGLCLWPDWQILGAVDAGSLGLVAAHAANGLADYPGGRLLIVEQNDGAGAAADRSVNEDPTSAAKAAVRILGPKRVGWLFCQDNGVGHIKDLNDLVAARGAEIARNHVKWWVELP